MRHNTHMDILHSTKHDGLWYAYFHINNEFIGFAFKPDVIFYVSLLVYFKCKTDKLNDDNL